ncbi:unnamed protein product [Nippostrongylus brasiliensis]|uniref:ANTH domain-containing protein n=1 Tax=Nippostrongylus brasiliensis TaxID=27835 RepID=A0A158R0W1_NIPBR|nr:unnamed protein product [Nippostrongylus brasiliensis]
MSAQFKEEAAAVIVEKLRGTAAYGFIQSLIRETVQRIVNPGSAIRVKSLTDQALICHSMIYHFLVYSGYSAAAELMQAECYEKFLSQEFLKKNVTSYNEKSVEHSLQTFHLHEGMVLKRPTVEKNVMDSQVITNTISPDSTFVDTKASMMEEIEMFADDAVERKEELAQTERMIDPYVASEFAEQTLLRSGTDAKEGEEE